MRRVAIGLAAAAVLVAVAWYLLSGSDRLGPLGEDLPFEPPPLRVPGREAIGREPWPALLVIDGERREVRLSYEPEDGGPRVREAKGFVPWPADLPLTPTLLDRLLRKIRRGETRAKRPALVVAARADTPWDSIVLMEDRLGGMPRVFLSGRGAGGRLGAVPYSGDFWFWNMGWGPGNPVFELRVSREGDRVRYRFGHWPPSWPERGRWEVADASFTAEEVAAGGEAPLLPAVADFLAERKPAGSVVILEGFPDVRYVDVLRAVECATGGGRVLFLGYPALKELEQLHLPDPGPDGAGLVEDFGRGPARAFVNVLPDGRAQMKGRELDPGPLRAELDRRGLAVHLRADENAPWSACRVAARWAQENGVPLMLGFRRTHPREPFERMLVVPPPCEGALRIAPARGATAGEVWRAVLEAVRDGAKGIELE